MAGKITRIFFKTTGILLLSFFLIGIILYFAIQTYRFQSWLGKQASAYLSKELETTVYVEKVRLRFFKSAELHKILILDLHKDTLLNGNLFVNIGKFSFKQQKIDISRMVLNDVTAKLIKYKTDSVFNYQFLADYFASGSKDTSTKGWDVTLQEIGLDNVAFVYRREKFVTPVTSNINFDDISLRDTYGSISGIYLKNDSICAKITALRTNEQTGFRLLNLNTDLTVTGNSLLCEKLRIKTPGSFVKGDVRFYHESWNDYPDFISKVKMNASLDDSTYADFRDIAAFASELNGLNETVAIAGEVKGYVNDMSLRKLRLSFGKHTHFSGNLTISGLPDIKSTFMHFDAQELKTHYSDLVTIPTYPFNEGIKMKLPVEILRLGVISYKGKFDGFLTDFTTYGKFNTGLGSITTKLSIKTGEQADNLTYKGEIRSEGFDLGTLLGQADFNNITLNAQIKGSGASVRKIDAEVVGAVSTIRFNNYDYKNLHIDASFHDKVFNGLLISKDPNADFDFNGTIDFSNKLPEMDFISTINSLRLKELNFTTSADSGVLSSQILIDISGDNIDNLTGQVNFDNTVYITKTKKYKLSTFNIVMDQATPDKSINLSSEYITAVAKGNFLLSNLKPAFEQLLYTYYPTFFKKPASSKIFTDQLSFKVTVKKFNTINELFLPDLMLSPGTAVDGNFNAQDEKLNVQINSAKVDFKSFHASNLAVNLNQNQNTVLADVTGQTFNISDSLTIANYNLSVKSVDKQSAYSFTWDNRKSPVNKGELKGKVVFENSAFHITNENLSATINDSTWQLEKPHQLVIEKNGSVKVEPMYVKNHEQVIEVAGALSENIGDSLIISTQNVKLAQFNPLLQIVKLRLQGEMNGNITLANAKKNFTFDGDLKMSKLNINDNTIGELVIKTEYATGSNSIKLHGYTSLGLQDESGTPMKNISFSGMYYLDKKEESVDVDFACRPANLKLLNPFLEGIITIKNGFVNGEGKVHGTPDKIKIDGKLRLFNSEIKVDYTNVSYMVTGDIEIMPDQIRFSDLLMREKTSRSAPQGTVNGNIFHDNFNKMQIDYDVTYRNMMVMNTTEKDNSTFYGKLFGTGRMGIYGFLNNLHMDVENTTEKNSRFVLPLDGPAELGESDFIHFVKRDTVKTRKQQTLTGFDLDMMIHATPDAQVQIILDKQHGDMLNAQGQGDLTLRINTLGKFEMFGDYFITQGDYLFTLENVINKKFDIEAGSSISWSGNPLNAEVDITTSYKQRVAISPLLDTVSSAQYKGRYPVDCKLLITGKLFSPEIRFVIDFPTLDATPKARIASVLSDEAELNRQVFSFLLFRSFVTPQIYNSQGGGVSAGTAAASTGSEMLSNRVSDFLNTYLGNVTGLRDLQLGLNYRPGGQNSSDAVDLALSKQFLNNKITVDGNFGVNNNSTTQKNNSSGLIGDVNVDYKLSDDGRYRLKGFNRSNDNAQITTTGGQYTQGVGLFFREEFETLSQLMKRYLKKDSRKQQPKP